LERSFGLRVVGVVHDVVVKLADDFADCRAAKRSTEGQQGL
jgi:hypothetical protein